MKLSEYINNDFFVSKESKFLQKFFFYFILITIFLCEFNFIFGRYNNELLSLGPYQNYFAALYSYPGISLFENSNIGIDKIFFSQIFDISFYFLILNLINDSYFFYFLIKFFENLIIFFLLYILFRIFFEKLVSICLVLFLYLDYSFFHILHLSISYSLIFFYSLIIYLLKKNFFEIINFRISDKLLLPLFVVLISLSFLNYGILVSLVLFIFFIYSIFDKKINKYRNYNFLNLWTFIFLISIYITIVLIFLFFNNYDKIFYEFITLNFIDIINTETTKETLNENLAIYIKNFFQILNINTRVSLFLFLILFVLIYYIKNYKVKKKFENIEIFLFIFISSYLLLYFLNPFHYYFMRISLILPIVFVIFIKKFDFKNNQIYFSLIAISQFINYLFHNYFSHNLNFEYLLILQIILLIFIILNLIYKFKFNFKFLYRFNIILFSIFIFYIFTLNIFHFIDNSSKLINSSRNILIENIKYSTDELLDKKNFEKIYTNAPLKNIFSSKYDLNYITNIYSKFNSKRFNFGVHQNHLDAAVIYLEKKKDYLNGKKYIKYKSFYYQLDNFISTNNYNIYLFLPTNENNPSNNYVYYYDNIEKQDIKKYFNLFIN